MDDFQTPRSNARDQQDLTERGVWGKAEEVPGAGRIMSVRGSGTMDYELPIVNFGFGFGLDDDSDGEVIMMSLGADVEQKVALPVLPRGIQYAWPAGTGGIQSPESADRRIEINRDEMFLRDGKFVVGTDRPYVIEVNGDDVTITKAGNNTVTVSGDDTVTITGAQTVNAQGGVTINVTGNATTNVSGNSVIAAGGTASISSGGALDITAPNMTLTGDIATVGTLTNNGQNVGSTHIHIDTPGLGSGATSGPQ